MEGENQLPHSISDLHKHHTHTHYKINNLMSVTQGSYKEPLQMPLTHDEHLIIGCSSTTFSQPCPSVFSSFPFSSFSPHPYPLVSFFPFTPFLSLSHPPCHHLSVHDIDCFKCGDFQMPSGNTSNPSEGWVRLTVESAGAY